MTMERVYPSIRWTSKPTCLETLEFLGKYVEEMKKFALMCIMIVSCLRVAQMADGSVRAELLDDRWSYIVLFEKVGSIIFSAIVGTYATERFSREEDRSYEFIRTGLTDTIKSNLQGSTGSILAHSMCTMNILGIDAMWIIFAVGILGSVQYASKKISIMWYISLVSVILGIYDASVSNDLYHMKKEDIVLKNRFSYVQNCANALCILATVAIQVAMRNTKQSQMCDWSTLFLVMLANIASVCATSWVFILKGVKTDQYNWNLGGDYNVVIPAIAFTAGYSIWFGLPKINFWILKNFDYSGVFNKNEGETKERYAEWIWRTYGVVFVLLCLDRMLSVYGLSGHFMALSAVCLMAVDFLLDQLMKKAGLSDITMSLQKLMISSLMPLGKYVFDINSKIGDHATGEDGDSLLNTFYTFQLGTTILSGCATYALMNHFTTMGAAEKAA